MFSDDWLSGLSYTDCALLGALTFALAWGLIVFFSRP